MKTTVRLLASMLILASANAFAAGATVDGRMDWVGTSYNDAAATAAGTGGSSAFQVSRLRLMFQSNLTEDIMGKVRLNLIESASTVIPESKINKYVDYAYLTQKFNPNFSASVGRVVNLIGGREAINGGGDYYFVSQAGAQIQGRATNAQYPVGLLLTGMFEDQRLDVIAANTTANDSVGTTATQTRMMMGVSYLGSFLDKTIMPIVSYHQDADNENNEKRTYLNAGIKWIIAQPFELELDYLANNNSFKTWAAAASKDTTSIVGSFRWKASDYFHAIAKVESSTDSVAAAAGANPTFNDNKITQIGLAGEYYPNTSATNMRYHLAAVQRTMKPGAGGDDQVETRVYAGVRFVADFLK